MGKNKTFVGGSELARRNARKRALQPKKRKVGTVHKNTSGRGILHKQLRTGKIKSHELFFSALLLSGKHDLQHSEQNKFIHQQIIDRAMAFLSLPCIQVNQTYQPNIKFHDSIDFYTSKVSALVEESRCILSRALNRNWSYQDLKIPVQLESVEQHKAKIFDCLWIFTFSKPSQQTKEISQGSRISNEEMKHFKPFSVFSIEDVDTGIFLLAYSYPMSHKVLSDDLSENKLRLMIVFNNSTYIESRLSIGSSFILKPLESFISEQRQFEAVINVNLYPPSSSFMNNFLGLSQNKKGKHTRFDSDGEEEEVFNENERFSDRIEVEDSDDKLEKLSTKLNATQETALNLFLRSAYGSMVLVQGPPVS